jgi:predicted O-linked N-acetylglucosamine transferase (SPINDLY family)
VQAGWFGYMNTTGLSTIDWRITDPQHDPAGSEAFYTEKLWRIPSLACFTPDPASPDPGPSPFERNGHVTFASVNNWAKVTEAAKDAWAAILRGAPGARLRIVARGGDAADVQRGIREAFARRGVDAGRIDVLPFIAAGRLPRVVPRRRRRARPVPLRRRPRRRCTRSGWACRSSRSRATRSWRARRRPRCAASARRNSRLHRSTTTSRSRSALAKDPERLGALRASLRERLRTCGALDYAGLARNVEAAFRGMWRAWCEAAPPT